MNIQVLSIFAAAFFATGSARALPPELAPPSGPPGAVMKTLDEVEPRTPISEIPFIITESGSYYLTGNLTGVAGQNGITIAEGVGNVTIDLMGFTLQGVEGSLNGIASADHWARADNMTVRNGVVSGFGDDGVALAIGSGHLIERIHVSKNGGTGVRSRATGTIIRLCTISENGSFGIWTTGPSCVIESCTVTGNVGSGILGSGGVSVIDCIASYNEGSGVSLGVQNRVVDTIAHYNQQHGIEVSVGSTVRNCSASVNEVNGIFAAGPRRISGTDSPGQTTVIVDSTTDDNGTAGIRIFQMSARVEGNHASRNNIGIQAESTGNLIVKNSAAENIEANFSIIEGNEVGLIGSIAEVGQHPWANFVPTP